MTTPDKYIDQFIAHTPEIAQTFSGTALLLPNLNGISNATGMPRSTFYNHGGIGDFLLDATGLELVHQGIVLGSPDCVNTLPLVDVLKQAREKQIVENLTREVSKYSPFVRDALIAELSKSD